MSRRCEDPGGLANLAVALESGERLQDRIGVDLGARATWDQK